MSTKIIFSISFDYSSLLKNLKEHVKLLNCVVAKLLIYHDYKLDWNETASFVVWDFKSYKVNRNDSILAIWHFKIPEWCSKRWAQNLINHIRQVMLLVIF